VVSSVKGPVSQAGLVTTLVGEVTVHRNVPVSLAPSVKTGVGLPLGPAGPSTVGALVEESST
jgi:hypothetical protein